ncbi:MAG: hypothetical protein CW691_09260 [Candidatus Bathyarchaeum sp.]|nr:MAG: hypothetical protein CW691_09260 [Candidatus Bathyarchaeum sp.]
MLMQPYQKIIVIFKKQYIKFAHRLDLNQQFAKNCRKTPLFVIILKSREFRQEKTKPNEGKQRHTNEEKRVLILKFFQFLFYLTLFSYSIVHTHKTKYKKHTKIQR